MTEFRQVLHEWARRILEERAGHAGPITILDVRIEHQRASSVSSEELWIYISFDHPGPCPWSAEYFAKYGYPPCSGRQSWHLSDSTDTVSLLNELLELGDV